MKQTKEGRGESDLPLGAPSGERQASHVVQLIDQAFAAARTFGGAGLLLDRYFLSIPALQRLTAEESFSHLR